MKRVHKAVIAAAVSSIPLTRAFGQLAAFPGAVGFGSATTGARGGTPSVYVVTNLNNSGAGSFRDAVSESNRIIVFAVSGYEDIATPISCASNLTILGQTAPGGGFGVYGAETSFYGQSNDIVQYMRFMDTTLDPGGQGTKNSSGNCVNLGNTNNMIFDHDSLEFASYNNVDASGTTGANNLTFQNSIIGDPIPDQQFNFHWQGNQATFIGNIFANAHNRSILAKGNLQFVNNVDYNYQAGLTTGDSSGHFDFDIINNYSMSGPSTTDTSDAYYQVDSNQVAYASGNLLDDNKDGNLNGNGANGIDGATVATTPWSPLTAKLPTLSAANAYAFDLAHSGDSLTHDPTTFASSQAYDQVDQTVINDVASYGTDGQLYGSQTNTGLSNGGLGVIISGNASTNAANDGIADSWKLTHGLSTTVADSTLLNPLGYTMVEQYASEIADLYQTQTWTAASGEWNNNSSSWPTLSGQAAGTPPGPYVHAVISGTGSADGAATVTTNGGTAYSLQIGADGLAAGEQLTISAGSLTVYNAITVGFQNNGTLKITGGTLTADNVQLGNTVWTGSGNSSADYTATTYTGTLVLSGGTLNVGVVAQGGGTPGNWTTGAAWTWSGGTLQAGPNGLLVTAPATLGSAAGILDTDGYSAKITSVLSGTGGLTKIGAGTATLTGLSTYTGPTTILAGALDPELANGGAPSGLGASSNAAANLILNGGTLMGTGSTDRLFTLESNSYLDNTNGMTLTNTGSIVLASGANLTLTFTGTNGGHNTFEPSLGDVGGGHTTTVTVSGTGLWDFSEGVKSYSGNTNVTSGELQTLSANALSPNSNMVISTGATLDFHGNSETINALSGNGSVTDSFGSAQTFTIGAANGSGTFTGTISGPVSVIKTGAGTQGLSGASTYTGATTVSQGILTTGTAGTLAAGGTASSIGQSTNAAANLILDGATLQYDSTGPAASTDRLFTITANGATLDASGTNTITFAGNGAGTANAVAYSGAGARTLTLTGSNTGNNILASIIADSDASDSTAITKNGAGTWELSGSNTYTGVTTINSGVLAAPLLSNGLTPGSLGDSSNAAANLVLDGGTLMGTGTTDRLFTLDGNSTLDSSDGMSFSNVAPILLAGKNLTLTLTGTSGAHNTFSPALGDPGPGLLTSVVKSGSGKWDFAGGLKNYSGDTDVTAGTLETLATNALSAESNMVISAGATLDLHDSGQTVNALSGNGTVQDSFSTGNGQTFSIGANNGSGTFSGAINGAILAIKIGSGTETLTGSNGYTGTTAINGGTLMLAPTTGTNNIASSPAINVTTGTTLDVNNVGGTNAQAFAVAQGQALFGTGTVSGAVAVSGTTSTTATISSGTGITAGSTPGQLTTGAQTWGASGATGSGTYLWKIAAPGSTGSTPQSGGSTTTWDDLNMSGLSVLAGGGNPSFDIQVVGTLNGLSDGGTYSWIIAQSTGSKATVNGLVLDGSVPANGQPNLLKYVPTGGSNDAFALNTSGFSATLDSGAGSTPGSGVFGLELMPLSGGTGDDLVLTYVAAPEPSSAVLASAGAAGMLLGRRRRRGMGRGLKLD